MTAALWLVSIFCGGLQQANVRDTVRIVRESAVPIWPNQLEALDLCWIVALVPREPKRPTEILVHQRSGEFDQPEGIALRHVVQDHARLGRCAIVSKLTDGIGKELVQRAGLSAEANELRPTT